MIEKDITTALQHLAESVTEHRVELGEKIAVIGTKVETLQESHENSEKKLDEVLRLELSCPARAGWQGLNREVGRANKRIDELKTSRGDPPTGNVDVSAGIGTVARQTFGNGSGPLVRMLALKALPYILLAAIALGAYLTSGGDTEAMTRALRAVSDAVGRVDKKIGVLEEKVDTAVDSDTDSAN